MKSRLIRLIFFVSLAFLIIRNLLLCVILPPWSFGDEMANFDYILKLGQGKIPHPAEFIEEDLFLFYKNSYDPRYLTQEGKKRQIELINISDLGLAAFSYQASQPPLAYLIYSVFRKIFLIFNSSMKFQVIVLRMIALAAVVGGLLLVYFRLIKQEINNPLFYFSLFFIAFLAQDMYFSINIDVFAFFFGCLIINRIFALYREPNSNYNWFYFALAVSLIMWVNVTGVIIAFLIFPLVVFSLHFGQNKKNERIWAKGIVYFLTSVLMGMPWYIFNQIRFGNPFRYVRSLFLQHVPTHPAQSFSLQNIINFFRAFSRTLFRGEFIWEGRYFDVLPEELNEILITVIPLAIIICGLSFILKARVNGETNEYKLQNFFLVIGFVLLVSFFLGNFFIGGLPFYHARMAFCGLYFILFLYAAGWLRIFRRPLIAYLVPAIWLLSYNLIYLTRLLSEVI